MAVEHWSMHYMRGTAALASGKVQAQTGNVPAESHPNHREAVTTYRRGTVPDIAIAECPDGLRSGKVCWSIQEGADATTPPGMSVAVAAIQHLARRADPHRTATPPTAAESG